MTKTLAQVPINYKATILEYIDDNVPVKLLEMGFLPGNIVLVKGQAAFKGALHVQVSGYNMALRLDEAAFINVDNIQAFDSSSL